MAKRKTGRARHETEGETTLRRIAEAVEAGRTPAKGELRKLAAWWREYESGEQPLKKALRLDKRPGRKKDANWKHQYGAVVEAVRRQKRWGGAETWAEATERVAKGCDVTPTHFRERWYRRYKDSAIQMVTMERKLADWNAKMNEARKILRALVQRYNEPTSQLVEMENKLVAMSAKIDEARGRALEKV